MGGCTPSARRTLLLVLTSAAANTVSVTKEVWQDSAQSAIAAAKPDWAVHDTFEWLADHRIPTREVHCLDDKWRIECALYLDDSPYMVPDLLRHRPDRTVCRFVRSWNRPVEGAVDVLDWDDVARVVKGLEAI